MEKQILCKKHGLTSFSLRSNKRYRCKKCNVEAVTNRRRKVKLFLIEYKGNNCFICGYNKSPAALDFHHLYGKDFSIAQKGCTLSIERLKKEVDKCDLLCNRCHAEVHNGLHPEYVLDSQKRAILLESENSKKEYILKTEKIKFFCLDCNKEIKYKSKRCHPCASKNRISPTKINWPSIKFIKEKLANMPCTKLAKELGVSDTAIRKYIRKNEFPNL